MKETLSTSLPVLALKGVNQITTETVDEFATLQNVAPDQVGRQTRILGKRLIEKRTSAVMTIHQFWTAFGYGSRLSQTPGGIISDPEDPNDVAIKIPIEDEPLNCRPQKPANNKLKLQYLNRKGDFLFLRYRWTKCSGTDFDSRTALVECSIGGVPIFDGSLKQAIVGFFSDGSLLTFDHGGQNIMLQAADVTFPEEQVVINLSALRVLAGSSNFTAKFKCMGYFYSYLNQGNITLYIRPYEKGKYGTYERIGVGANATIKFTKAKKYKQKSFRRNIVTQTSTPILTTGDLVCYVYVKIFPNSPKKDKIWIDDV